MGSTHKSNTNVLLSVHLEKKLTDFRKVSPGILVLSTLKVDVSGGGGKSFLSLLVVVLFISTDSAALCGTMGVARI